MTLPTILLLAAALLLVPVRSALHRWRYGCWGISYGIGETIILTDVLLTMYVQAEHSQKIGLVSLIESRGLYYIGAALFVAGGLFTWCAQDALGPSWRSSIDQRTKPGLRTGGLYRYSRNPVIVGLLACMAGYTLMLPTWLSVVLLLASVTVLRIHIVEEEHWLKNAYGAEYDRYCERVGRFAPRFSLRRWIWESING